MPATVVSARDNEQGYVAAFERRRGELPGNAELRRIRDTAFNSRSKLRQSNTAATLRRSALKRC